MKETYHFIKSGVNTTYELTPTELEKRFKIWLLDHTKDEQKLAYLITNSSGLKVIKLIMKFLLENHLGLHSTLAHPDDEIELIEFLADVKRKFMESIM